MALKSRLGFGMMRLPVKNGNPTDFDYDELNSMVDTFIEAGYTYFDTSYVYHNGKSEEATRKAVVERYPRDAFTVATKFPTFSLEREDQIEPIFAEQLENLGVDYIDYYLLHNFQTVYYDGIAGQGGIVKTEAPVYACKVQLVCPKCGKPTRIGHVIEGDKKLRVCKKCGKSFE